ncbi:uncharacterized protein LOC131230415 isoform X2 [Magnolia sinica]|uniref:uncharacterized protein LOC131230415 isoform X2 n=1 Tax=Magnolia sinica TaxID=86752 RepID=UPI00265ACFBD|nr:uncharacterized protein LOC131230415 isoform X2 [Magnolia sinica]
MAPIYYIIIAFPCMVGAMALAMFHIYRHLLNYTEPTYQRYIVRIIFMVPVFALLSFLSLVFNESSIYFNSIREIRFIRRCKQGCLQFVILKPVLVAVTFIFYAKGKYEDGNFSATQAYLYVTIIYTISYSMALYALALFYVACRDLLRPFNPVPKFVMIKSVVFLTYWQGVLVFLAAKSGFLSNPEEAAEFQNFIVCLEMLVAALGHRYAFPYKEYAGANIGASRGLTGNLVHALKFNDLYHDTVHQFAPTYHDYVLYNSCEGEEGATKYRSRTFVPTGQEMDDVRKNKHTLGNKIDNIQLSSPSSSGTITPEILNTVRDSMDPQVMKPPLLMEPSDSLQQSYDLSLVELDLSSYPEEVPAVSDSGTQ